MVSEIENIIELAENKGVTAYEIAKYTDLTEAGILKILSGKTKRPHKSTTKTILNFLRNYDQRLELLKQNAIAEYELGNRQLANQSVVRESSEVFSSKAGNVFEQMSSGKVKLFTKMVHVKAQASYTSQFQDADYVDELSDVSWIIDKVVQGSYRSFEVMNDSMNDGTINAIPDGSIVLGRELQKHHWQNALNINKYPNWVIVHKDGLMIKEIINHDTDKAIIKCHSINPSPEYANDFDLDLSDVYQLYNVIKRQLD